VSYCDYVLVQREKEAGVAAVRDTVKRARLYEKLLHTLSAAGSEVPTIVLTAHGDADARVSCLQAGAIAVLQKPFDTGVLVQSVKTVMGSAHGRSGEPSSGPDF
jgi:FixJ family two-component response regulator